MADIVEQLRVMAGAVIAGSRLHPEETMLGKAADQIAALRAENARLKESQYANLSQPEVAALRERVAEAERGRDLWRADHGELLEKFDALWVDMDRLTRGTYSLELARLSSVNLTLRERVAELESNAARYRELQQRNSRFVIFDLESGSAITGTEADVAIDAQAATGASASAGGGL